MRGRGCLCVDGARARRNVSTCASQRRHQTGPRRGGERNGQSMREKEEKQRTDAPLDARDPKLGRRPRIDQHAPPLRPQGRSGDAHVRRRAGLGRVERAHAGEGTQRVDPPGPGAVRGGEEGGPAGGGRGRCWRCAGWIRGGGRGWERPARWARGFARAGLDRAVRRGRQGREEVQAGAGWVGDAGQCTFANHWRRTRKDAPVPSRTLTASPAIPSPTTPHKIPSTPSSAQAPVPLRLKRS